MVITLEDIKTMYSSLFNDKNDILTVDGGHILYRHTGTSQYKQLTRSLAAGQTVRLRVHQVVILYKMQVTSMPHGLEASHLCHIKNCIAEGHIVAEPHTVNMQRVHCADERKCRNNPTFCHGHGQYPSCIGMY